MSQCVICSDLFDGIERAMAAPCGHVFHSKCLLKWLEVGKSCPECRKKVSKQSVLDLYFSVNDTEIMNCMSLSNENDSLKTALQASTSEANALRKKNEELQKQLAARESRIETLHRANVNFEQRVNTYTKEIPRLRKELQNEMNKNCELRKELLFLNDIKVVVNASQKDADDILKRAVKSATAGPDLLVSTRLSYCCSITKRELRRSIDEKNDLRKEINDVNKNLGLTTAKFRLSKARVQTLEQKVNNLQTAIRKSIENGAEIMEVEPTDDPPYPEGDLDDPPCLRDFLTNKSLLSMNIPLYKDPRYKGSIFPGLIPITCGLEVTPKRKMNIVVLDKEREKVSATSSQNLSPIHFSPIAKRRKETNSVSSVGYNGLGGHHSVINRDAGLSTAARPKTGYKG